MKASKSFYSCQQCGAQSPKWLGRCPDCNAWNSFVEEAVAPAAPGAARPMPAALGGGGAHLYA